MSSKYQTHPMEQSFINWDKKRKKEMLKWDEPEEFPRPLRIVACAPPACKCPIMDILEEERRLIILDDYKGEVLLTFDEFELLYKRFKEYTC